MFPTAGCRHSIEQIVCIDRGAGSRAGKVFSLFENEVSITFSKKECCDRRHPLSDGPLEEGVAGARFVLDFERDRTLVTRA